MGLLNGYVTRNVSNEHSIFLEALLKLIDTGPWPCVRVPRFANLHVAKVHDDS